MSANVAAVVSIAAAAAVAYAAAAAVAAGGVAEGGAAAGYAGVAAAGAAAAGALLHGLGVPLLPPQQQCQAAVLLLVGCSSTASPPCRCLAASARPHQKRPAAHPPAAIVHCYESYATVHAHACNSVQQAVHSGNLLALSW